MSWSRFVSERVAVKKNEDRRCGEFREKGVNGVLHSEDELNHSAFFNESRDWAYTESHDRYKHAVVTETAGQAA